MTLAPAPGPLGRANQLPCLAAIVAAALGATALLGWLFDLPALRSILSGRVAMNPLTALAFLLASASLVLLRYRTDRSGRAVGYGLAALVAVVGLAKLSDLAGSTNFALDQLLFSSRLTGTDSIPANRMAPNTAVNFVLVAAALLTVRLVTPPGRRPTQYLALATGGFSMLALLGYTLDVDQLYRVSSFIPMALNTTLAFAALSLGLFAAVPDRGLATVFVADNAGGVMARRLLPCAVLVPAALAWMRLRMEEAGLIDREPAVPVMVFASIVVLSAIIWAAAIRLARAEDAREGALTELRHAQADLEERITQRTAELEERNLRLRDSEARYRLLFDANPRPMWVYERESLRFLAVNQAAVELYGYTAEEFLTMRILDIRPNDDVPDLLKDLARPRTEFHQPREWRHLRKDHSVITVEVSSHVMDFDGRPAVLVLASDVSERKKLEGQLRQAQKMEAIGLLAGGVAHDFNNLLTVILGHSQLMRRRLAPGSELSEDIDDIVKAAQRAASLTRQLLAFSRQQVLQPVVLDLNAVITELDKMLRRLIGEDIDLVTAISTELGQVKADPGQIEQVLMNLAINARDAMPEGGKLTIETANVELDEHYAMSRVDVRSGRYVMLAVSDSGHGMTPEIVSRIFEPFFTTKELGRGTGLGLSTVHGIVKQSGGHIEVYSEQGQGTIFKVYLPRIDERAGTEAQPAAETPSQRGSETILLVEDEDMVRQVIRQTLVAQGYQVLEAVDGSEAIALCEREPGINLIITDVVMPLMNGPELIQRVATVRSDLKVLFISGYTDRALIHQGLRKSGTAFLQKPFTPDVLVQAVRSMFDAPAAQAA